MTDKKPPEYESMRERLAQAIYESHVSQAFSTLDVIPVEYDKIAQVLREAASSNDRAAAILVFALVDDLMIYYFTRFLNPEVTGGVDRLFEPNGILGTSSNRIALAAALSWIFKETQDDLHIIRKIRNYFAHNTEIHFFDHPKIQSLIGTMQKSETGLKKLVPGFEETKWDSRSTFLARSSIVIARCTSQMIACRIALNHQIDPQAILGNRARQPKQMQELMGTAVDFIAFLFGVRLASSDDDGQESRADS